jgi:hypothetical protein
MTETDARASGAGRRAVETDTDAETGPGSALPGLVLVAVDAAVGWLLYLTVDPRFGLVLWGLAALVVGGLLVDGVGRRTPSVGLRPRPDPSSGRRGG